MPGPESSPEPDDPRVAGRPLSPDVHAGHAPPHARPFAGQGPDEPEAAEGPRPSSKGRKRRGFKLPPLAPVLGLLASYPRRRRERAEAASEARPEGARPAPRPSFLGLKPETRVGLAAVLSFVLIFGVLIAKKGWTGKTTKAPLTQIPNVADKKDKTPADKDKPPTPAVSTASREDKARPPRRWRPDADGAGHRRAPAPRPRSTPISSIVASWP